MMPLRYRIALLLLAAVPLVGCGGGTAASNSVSLSSPSAGLNAGSTSIDFGSLTVGSSKSNSFSVTNSSTTDSISVSQLTLTGAGFSIVSVPSTPFTVAPGQSAAIVLSFTPSTVGSASGSLVINSNASDSAVTISLTGTGSAPAAGQLSVSPPSMNFGTIAVGSTSTAKTGTLTAGGADVHVSTVDQTGQGYTLSGITFPVTVPAGKSISFSVTFSPSASGSAPGSLAFVSDATNSPATETLSGSGGTSTPVQHSVTLSWSASTSSVQGYNIYRSTVSGGPYTKLNSSLQPSTTYTDSTVQSSTTYFYVATAVDSSSNESGFSNETSAAVP